MKTVRLLLGFLIVFCMAFPIFAEKGGKRSKLKEVLDRGVLNCAVRSGTAENIPGDAFSDTAAQKIGELYCRGLAEALQVDVNIIKLSVPATFESLKENTVDVSFRTLSETLGRDVVNLVNAVGIMFFETYTAKTRDTQYPLSASVPDQVTYIQIKGLRVCVRQGQIQETIAKSWGLTDENLRPTASDYQDFLDGYCEVNMNGSAFHAALNNDPEVLTASTPWSESPLMVTTSEKHSDPKWDDLIKYYMGGLRAAVRYGINKANVAMIKGDPDLVPEAKALLGVTTNCRGETAGDLVGLDDDWMVRAIAKVGNYYEIYDASLGHEQLGGLDKESDDAGLNQVYIDANGRTNGVMMIHVHNPAFAETTFASCSSRSELKRERKSS